MTENQLSGELRSTLDNLESTHRILNLFLNNNKRYFETNGYESYTSIPNSYEMVYKTLKWLRKHPLLKKNLKQDEYGLILEPTFLDIGCGTGGILQIAKELYYNVTGIEHNKQFKKFYTTAKEECFTFHNIHFTDALKFKDYDKYNVIYYYCPIAETNKQIKLERKIENDAKKGTFIIACLKQERKIEKDKRFKIISKDYSDLVFQKIKN